MVKLKIEFDANNIIVGGAMNNSSTRKLNEFEILVVHGANKSVIYGDAVTIMDIAKQAANQGLREFIILDSKNGQQDRIIKASLKQYGNTELSNLYIAFTSSNNNIIKTK